MRTIFIGDVHGCLDELDELLGKVAKASADRIVFVGDLTAKGPDSVGVIRRVRALGALAVRGNHDEHVLRYRLPDEGGRPLKPLHRRIAEAMDEADWAFLGGLPPFLRLPELNVLVVHAGLRPGMRPEEEARETLLNVRSIMPDGRASKRLDEGEPWARVWRGPEHVVFGHDAVRGLQKEAFATGLDTGCVYGNELTALVLPERRFVSVRARRAYAEARLPD